MYLPGIEVSDDNVSWWGDAPAWKCPDAELLSLHHAAFQNKFLRMQNSLIQVVLLNIAVFFYLN